MRVLFVLPHLRTTGGGVIKSMYHLLPALRVLGVEPSVACLRDKEPSMREAFEAEGIPVAILPRDAKARMWTLRRIIRGQDIDVVHTSRGPSVISRLACVGLPVPLVTSIVNIRNPRQRGRFEVAYQWTHRLTDRFHAVSFAAKSYGIHDSGFPSRESR